MLHRPILAPSVNYVLLPEASAGFKFLQTKFSAADGSVNLCETPSGNVILSTAGKSKPNLTPGHEWRHLWFNISE